MYRITHSVVIGQPPSESTLLNAQWVYEQSDCGGRYRNFAWIEQSIMKCVLTDPSGHTFGHARKYPIIGSGICEIKLELVGPEGTCGVKKWPKYLFVPTCVTLLTTSDFHG